jgi:hypothetical protein
MSIISRELLSEVLGIDVAKIIKEEYSNNVSIYERDFQYPVTYNASAYLTINIHELAHKCKEWAYENGYHVNSLHRCANQTDWWESRVWKFEGGELGARCEKASTEPEAIFKSAQWILDNKETECKH